MNRVAILFLILQVLLSDLSAAQDEADEDEVSMANPLRSVETQSFDSSARIYTTLLSGDLTSDVLISCRFAVDTVVSDSGSTPSVGLSFSSDDPKDDGEYVPIVRLWAFPEEHEQQRKWRYKLTIHHGEDSPGEYRQSVIAIPNTSSDSILPMMLIWHDQNYAQFLVGDDTENMSAIDVSQLELVSWEVYASGAKGETTCSATPF